MFALKFIDPDGTESYWPVGFGFTSHAHAASLKDAERFESKERALRSLNGYWYPAAFWNSERVHRQNMIEKFRRWKYEIVPISNGGLK